MTLTAAVVVLSLAAFSEWTHEQGSGETRMQADEAAVPPRPAAVRVRSADVDTPSRLEALRRRSPTAQQLIDTLDQTPGLLVHVKVDPALQSVAHVEGQGHYGFDGSVFVGVITYQREQDNSQDMLVVIAHELAHAFELAATARRVHAQRVSDVDRALRAQCNCSVADSPFETAFVRELTRQVRRELMLEAGAPGAFFALAAKHRLADDFLARRELSTR